MDLVIILLCLTVLPMLIISFVFSIVALSKANRNARKIARLKANKKDCDDE